MEYTEATNLRYSAPDGSTIDMDVHFLDLGKTVPFTASAHDDMEHGRELFERAKAGDFGPIALYIAPPDPVPQVVTRAQGKAALISAGLWDAVLAYVNGIQDATERALAEVALHDTLEWRRDSPFLNAAATAIGLTKDDLDNLFRRAAKIEL